jgi:hypothetical protein
MEVIARKHSTDPVQEHLREHKAGWNKDVSAFIKYLIALKKAMNGRPVPELGLGKGDIKFPLPDSVPSMLDRLASEYEKLTTDGKSIVQEQVNYSEARKRPSETLASNDDDVIIKEAANVFTRLWTYLATPFRFGDEDRWARKNMLSASAELQRDLGDIGRAVVSGSENAIPEAIYSAKSFYVKLKTNLIDPFKAMSDMKIERQNQGEEEEEAEEEEERLQKQPQKPLAKQPQKPASEPPQTSVQEPQAQEQEDDSVYQNILGMEEDVATRIRKDVNYILASLSISELDEKIARDLKEAEKDLSIRIVKFKQAIKRKEDPREIHTLYNDIITLYNEILGVAIKYKVVAKEKFAHLDDPIQKFAQATFSRWLNRQKVKLFKDQDYRLRLAVDSAVSSALSDLNSLMDVLQRKNAPIDLLARELINFSLNIGEMMSALAALGDNHNSTVRIKKLRARSVGARSIEADTIRDSDINALNRYASELGALRKLVEKQEEDIEEEDKPSTKQQKQTKQDAKIPGFKDIAVGKNGGISIPKSKFHALVRSGILVQLSSDRVKKSPMHTLPAGFENVIKDGVNYRVQHFEQRTVLTPMTK